MLCSACDFLSGSSGSTVFLPNVFSFSGDCLFCRDELDGLNHLPDDDLVSLVAEDLLVADWLLDHKLETEWPLSGAKLLIDGNSCFCSVSTLSVGD